MLGCYRNVEEFTDKFYNGENTGVKGFKNK